MNLTIIILFALATIAYLVYRYLDGDLPPFIGTLRTTLDLLWNKGAAILLLAFLLHQYLGMDSTEEDPKPFMELFYAAILGTSVIVLAPIFRLLVFPEAAAYAESGKLTKDIEKGLHPLGLRHYWFATGISYLVTVLCVSSLL